MLHTTLMARYGSLMSATFWFQLVDKKFLFAKWILITFNPTWQVPCRSGGAIFHGSQMGPSVSGAIHTRLQQRPPCGKTVGRYQHCIVKNFLFTTQIFIIISLTQIPSSFNEAPYVSVDTHPNKTFFSSSNSSSACHDPPRKNRIKKKRKRTAYSVIVTVHLFCHPFLLLHRL